jgi:hypothetical protein
MTRIKDRIAIFLSVLSVKSVVFLPDYELCTNWQSSKKSSPS